MTVNETLTALMDKVRSFQGRSDKLSIQDLQQMLDSLNALKFGGDQYASNSDTTRDSGIYYCNTGVSSKPVDGTGLLVVLAPGNKGWDGGRVTQFFIDVDNRQLYQRSMDEKTNWTSWNKLGGVNSALYLLLLPGLEVMA